MEQSPFGDRIIFVKGSDSAQVFFIKERLSAVF